MWTENQKAARDMPRGVAYLACMQVCQATNHVQGDVLASVVPAKVPGPVIGDSLTQISTL